MIYLPILFPLAMAVVLLIWPWERSRAWLVPVGGIGQLVLSMALVFAPDHQVGEGLGGWLQVDPLAKVFLGYLAVLFCICSLYTPTYLELRSDRPNRNFCASLFGSLGMMTL